MAEQGTATESRARLAAFRLILAVVLPILMLLLAEGAVRMAGLGFDPSFTTACKMSGTDGVRDNPAFSWQFFPRDIARTVPSFVFPQIKPSGTIRIFVLGASAAQGDPEPSYGFARILEVMLESRHPNVDFEVVNTAITAINSHVVLPIAREVADADGDLFIIYLGNNEVVGPFGASNVFSRLSSHLPFIRAQIAIRRTRLGQTLAGALGANRGPGEWQGMQMFLGQEIRRDDERLQSIYGHFTANLEDMIAVVRDAGAKVLLSTVATNLRDCGPFGSLNDPDLLPDQLASWTSYYRAGIAHAAGGDTLAAIAAFRRAVAIDPSYADLQFRLGRLELARGDTVAGERALKTAQDQDVLRFRADSVINGIIREVGASLPAGSGALIDAAAAVEAACDGGVSGAEMFVDHVHLNFDGNHVVAGQLLPVVEKLLLEPADRPSPKAPELDVAESAARLAFTPYDRLRVAKDMAIRIGRAPFTNQSDHAQQVAAIEVEIASLSGSDDEAGLVGADLAYRRALGLRPDDARLLYNHGVVLDELGDRSGALRAFGAYRELLPHDVPGREKYSAALVSAGRIEDGIAECRLLIRDWPDFEVPYYTLAYGLARLGRLDQSLDVYRQLLVLDPGKAADIYNEVGRIEIGRGNGLAAAEAFKDAVAAAGKDEDTQLSDLYYNLGAALHRAGRRDAARAATAQAASHYESALAADPDALGPLLMLGRIALEAGEPADGAKRFRRAAGIEPDRIEAHLGLVQCLMASGQREAAALAAREGVEVFTALDLASEAEQLRRVLVKIDASGP